RALFSNISTSLRVKISWRHRPNFSTQAAGKSDEGEISRLVWLAKPGLCCERGRTTFSPRWRKRVSDSLQNGLSGPITATVWFTSGPLYVSFSYVDFRGAGEERFEVGEISGLHPRHCFVRPCQIGPN